MGNIAVIGATSGLGHTVASCLSSELHNLHLFGRNREKLKSLESHLINSETNVYSYQIDYNEKSITDDIPLKINKNTDNLSGIVVITPRPEPTNTNFPSEDYWNSLFNLCFIQPMELLKQLIPLCKSKSKIVIISGISSIQAVQNHPSAFAVIRMAWLAQAKCLANELGPKSINVNTISPGGVLTESAKEKMTEKGKINNRSFEEQYQLSIQNVPLRKYADPKEVAAVISFLLSDKSSHLTGLNLACDGGFIQSY